MPYTYPGDGPCRFCALDEAAAQGEVVFEDALAVVLAAPWQRGPGSLVAVPRRHVRALSELAGDEAVALFAACAEATARLRRAYDPDGVNTWIAIGVEAEQPCDHLLAEIVPRFENVAYAWVPPDALVDAPLEARRAVAAELRGT